MPCSSTVPPLTGWPTSVVIAGAVGSTSTVNAGVDAALVRLAASISVAVKVCTPSANVVVVVMSKVPPTTVAGADDRGDVAVGIKVDRLAGVSPVPCSSTVPPLTGWPTRVVIDGAVGSTSTVKPVTIARWSGSTASVSVAVKRVHAVGERSPSW